MSRKLLSWILILSMIFSLCSVPAFAEAENGEDEQIEDVLDEDPGIPSDNEEETASSADDQASDDGDLTEDDQIPDDQSNEELSASPDDPAAEAEPLPGSAESDQLDSTDPSTEGGEEFISEDDEALSSENNGITPNEADSDLPEEADRSISVDEAADDDADEPDEILYGEVCVTVPGTDSGGQDSDALLSGYFDLLVRGGNGGNRGSAAGDLLAGSEAILYSFLAEKIDLVAKGQLSSTEFSILASSLNLTRSSWSISELGLEDDPIFDSEGYLTDASMRALDAALGEVLSTSSVNSALLADYPFELFWYDKTSGYYFNYYIIYDGESLGINPDGDFTVRFYVADEYAVESFSTNTELIQSVQNAASNARSIVSAYSSNSDRAKLMGYLTEICSRVSYNYDALEPNVSYGNPWQLIWVFDGDTETNVVCEGYSKAFQYLCDLSSFESNLVRCLSVSGSMGGPHMWNVVRLADGINYLVDVTNCDSGMIGEPDKLFLAVPTSGDLDDGYTFTANGYQIGYTYDAETLATFSREDLVIGETEQRQIIDSGNCGADGDNLNWNLYDNGLLEITGSGDMADFRDASDAPWYSYRESICTVVIAEGATSIGRCAFDRYVVLTEVSLPAGLTLIGEDAFCGCSSLTEISLPSSVTTLSMYAFAECTALTEIVIPSGVSAIPLAAFASCTSLVSVTLPSSVRSIGRFAFSGCEKLSDAVLPEGVTSIADSAFRLCSSLSDFSLPQSLTFIGPGAFHGCSMPNSLVLPDQLTSIGDYAFSYCTGVESVSIPSSVAELGISVFSCCSALRTITVDGNNTAYSSADGVLFDKECRTLLCYPAGGATSYQIPSTVTRLGLSCFSGCRNLSEISIPDSVVSIGRDAFWLCPFETVIIPASVTSIESRAFYACELSSILFMGGPPAIEADAFENDSANAIYYSDKGWTAADFGNYGGTLNWIEIVEGEPTLLSWEWTDFTAAKARILGSDDGLVHTLDAVVAETRVEPGCETEGSVLHTATVTFEETSFSDVKTESIPALGHQWDSGVVITIGSRPEDGEILYTCLRDSSHTKTVTVEKDSQGDYIFSSFEQLKLLARYAYDEERWTSARCSSDDLMIRESLTMPDGLDIYFSNLNVPLGVNFTVNGSISGHSMIVDGTMYLGDNRFGVGDFVNHVTVNGHLTLDMWLWVTEITGRQNITYEDNGRIAYQPYVSTEEELRLAIDAALQAPEHTSYSIYVQNPLTLEQDLTIPVTGFNEKIRTISFNGLTIPAGVTLTNNGYLDFYQMPQIDGTLVNNGWLEVYTSVHSEQTLRDFLAHEWTNVVAGERSFTQQIVSVYGEISLTEDLEILPTQRVDLDDSCLFSIPEGRTLTVNGDLLQHSGEILLDGTLRVNGFAEQYPYGQEVPVIRISDTGCLEGSGTLTIANGLDPAVTLIGYSGPEPIRVDNDYNDYWIIYLSDGWSVINGERYYKLHGSWVTGWKQIDGEWYFFQSSGAAATGWQKIGNVWYYFLSNGTMATGMQVIGGKTYGFADNGRMLTGWQQIDDAWYYFQSSGAAATGWQKIGNVWYYFLFDGAMATGMQVIGGKTYGFADNGRMFTGWKQIDGNWYYFLDNGAASTGWKPVCITPSASK